MYYNMIVILGMLLESNKKKLLQRDKWASQTNTATWTVCSRYSSGIMLISCEHNLCVWSDMVAFGTVCSSIDIYKH